MSEIVNWTTDEEGELRGASFHDGNIVGFRASDDIQEFAIRNTSGQIVTIRLSKVLMFTVGQFWDGAIVANVNVWPIAKVPDSSWNLEDGAWSVLLAGRARKEDMRPWAERIASKYSDTMLVQVSCSYGGSFCALCRSMDVRVDS
jgi:hypothetical protein